MKLANVFRAARGAKSASATSGSEQPIANSRFEVNTEPAVSWIEAKGGGRITVQGKPLIASDTKIFTMGSCFAVEIRNALIDSGHDVYPKYASIKFDPKRQQLAKMPARDNINHYDTFVIRQEFERAFAAQHFNPEDFFLHERNRFPESGNHSHYQDPHRKQIFAADQSAIIDLSRKLDECIRHAIFTADVFVITLGLIEVWRNKKTRLWICQAPETYDVEASQKIADFHVSTFSENYGNIKTVVDLIAEKRPNAEIVLTVSPVPLGRTFRDIDVVTANMESKSILRAVAGQVCRESSNVHYWPSFEYSIYANVYEPDKRHVSRSAVDHIVKSFLQSYKL